MIEIGSNIVDAYRKSLVSRLDDNNTEPCSSAIWEKVNMRDLLKEPTKLDSNDFHNLQYCWTVRQDGRAAAAPIGTYNKFIDLLNEHAQALGKSWSFLRHHSVIPSNVIKI